MSSSYHMRKSNQWDFRPLLYELPESLHFLPAQESHCRLEFWFWTLQLLEMNQTQDKNQLSGKLFGQLNADMYTMV